MSVWTVLVIALGVSADAFAVSLGKGLQMRRLRLPDAVLLALTFGVFQAVMPLVGWFLGTSLRGAVTGVDHWIAFTLLALIGLKMIWDGYHGSAADAVRDGRIPTRELLLLGLATSIDALAVGISLAFADVSITLAVVLIGVVTFVLSLVGVVLGHRAGLRFRGPAEIAGGLILIFIGTRILLDHLGVW